MLTTGIKYNVKGCCVLIEWPRSMNYVFHAFSGAQNGYYAYYKGRNTIMLTTGPKYKARGS